MTPASLEALARALARLEPDVFILDDSFLLGGVKLSAGNTWCDAYSTALDGRGSPLVDDDRLFGAVWRCAVARGWNCTVSNFCGDVSAKVEFDAEIDPVQADAATPGVALALAYCDACEDKVGL